MPSWIAIPLAIGFLCGWGPFLYARQLAREDGDPLGQKPLRFGGILNFHLVTSVLRNHARRGDCWAGRAFYVYAFGSAILPTIIAVLFVTEFWTQ